VLLLLGGISLIMALSAIFFSDSQGDWLPVEAKITKSVGGLKTINGRNKQRYCFTVAVDYSVDGEMVKDNDISDVISSCHKVFKTKLKAPLIGFEKGDKALLYYNPKDITEVVIEKGSFPSVFIAVFLFGLFVLWMSWFFLNAKPLNKEAK
jgi:hypothetical protein